MTTPAARLVERFYREVWNKADEALAQERLHPAFAFRGSLGPRAEGPEGFILSMHSIHAALAGYTCTIEEPITEGTRAAARVRFAGTHRGTLPGVAATGREIAWIGAAFFRDEWAADRLRLDPGRPGRAEAPARP
jgi:predicted ester cyclase